MKPIHNFIVNAELPERIAALKEIAYNFWWSWHTEAKELFIRIDRDLWEEVDHNPVLMINRLSNEELENLANQHDFTSYLDYIYSDFQKYMGSDSWYSKIENKPKGTIAYFSMEYGINESFPVYSGGLGILSGDHMKSASDLGLDLVGVGLLYQQGYFRQYLTQNGWQNEFYKYNDFYSMPLRLMKNEDGSTMILDVDMPEGKAFFQIWKLNVGRITMYLLDTNVARNQNIDYREISDQLYGGDRETRMRQEVVLGIGGMRALKAVGIIPEAIHINEGHAAFALLERTRMYMDHFHMDFHTAYRITKASSIFTTHTPVPAGNEAFNINRTDKYFHSYYYNLGLSKEEFMNLGQQEDYNEGTSFSMTVLGLKLTSYHNGVSKLHGEVSRTMWHRLWETFPEDEVPIGHITNGIHTMTWVAREFSDLFDRYLSPRWKTEPDNQEIWDKVDIIPSEELWREKQRRRVRLVLFARDYLKKRKKGFLAPEQVNNINEYLDPDALTIGFARRFATYKRALLLFTDMDRLSSILKNSERPVQLLIAGKAHPHDVAGKEVIQTIIQRVREYGLERHVVFLEDYDMVIARYMVKGCDLWLNNPIRPMEASGTSGMKAALNGTLNLSILDGWWDEAFNGENGFVIGDGEEYINSGEQDIVEAGTLYDAFEQIIVPMFYERSSSHRFPDRWTQYMKNNIKTIAGQFSSSRMLKEYTNNYYLNALRNNQKYVENNAEKTRHFKGWCDKVRHEWNNTEITDVKVSDNGENFLGKPIEIKVKVELGGLQPSDVVVQVYYGSVDHNGHLQNTKTENLTLKHSHEYTHEYEGSYLNNDTGMQGLTVRVLPVHDMLVNSSGMYLCTWAKE